MIFDSLTHVTPDGRWFDTAHDASLTRLLREMDRAEVDRAVVVALANHIENDFVLRVCSAYRDRLVPGASLDPSMFACAREAREQCRSLFRNEEFALLKLHPRLNRYDPLDPRCLGVLDALAELDRPVPVWLDTMFRYRGPPLRKPAVETIHELLARFPSVSFVLLHGGGPLLLQVAELVREFPNATIDLSLTLLSYRPSSVECDLAFVLAKRDRRTVVGSDFPEFTPAQAVAAVRRIAECQELAEEKVRSVLGDNLGRLLAEALSLPSLHGQEEGSDEP